MSNTKNLFAALSEESVPKQSPGQAKKKGKKKAVPLHLHVPSVPIVEQAAPRHPLRTEMSEDEELRAALEASKKEAEKSKLAQQYQWSSVAKTTSSTPTTAVSQAQTNGTTSSRPKTVASNPPLPAKATSSIIVPSRPSANPWASHPVVPPRQADPAPPPPSESASVPSRTIDEAPSIHSHMDDNLDSNDDEMFIVPIVSNASRVPAPSLKPISRPQTLDKSPLDMQAKLVASVLEDDVELPLKNAHDVSPLNSDDPPYVPYPPTGASTSNSSSPIATSLSPTSTPTPSLTVQQLQETLQGALLRIAALEQANEVLFSRLTQIVEASMHLERFVNLNTAENNIIKTQVQDLRNSFYLSSGHTTDSSSNAFQGSQNISSVGYSPFISMPAMGSQQAQRPQTMNSTPSASNHSVGLSSLGFPQNGIPPFSGSPSIPSNQSMSDQQGLGAGFFGRNESFM